MASLETLNILVGIDHDSLYLHEHICINTVALKTTRQMTIIE